MRVALTTIVLFAGLGVLAGIVNRLVCPRVSVTPTSFVEEMESAVAVGSPAAAIEDYLKQHSIDFSFDEFQSRYQAIIRHPTSNCHAVVIYVYTGAERAFDRVEAEDAFTLL